MNLKQLEEITSHAKEIAELLDSDTASSDSLQSDFRTFERTLRAELKDMVFKQYLENVP